MARRGLIVKTPVRAGAETGRDKSFRSSELSAMMSEREVTEAKARRIRAEGVSEKRRNETPINPLKTNDSAKSRDFVPNDFKGLALRLVSLGAIFVSFGASIRSQRAPLEFVRKEAS